jgi:mannitol/fructose-specific phosphotransferase system IIA component (Ntr-type)
MGDSPERFHVMAPKIGVRGIARYSAPDLMCPGLAAENHEQAIEELIAAMASAGWVANEAKLLAQELDRENQVPTVIGHNLAFPHVRGLDSGGLRLSIGTSEPGIDFGSSSAQIVCFAVIPTAGNTVYLRLLSELIEVLEKADSRAKLLACQTPGQLWGAVTKMAGGRL